MALVTLHVNGASHEVDVDATTPLLYVLRNDLNLQGPRFGCGLAQCGACTILVDGDPIRSCVTPVSAVSGEITTLEGLAQNGELHPIQQAWIDEQVPQCGYCQNGQILTAKVLLDANPNPTDAEIRDGMQGALCRCMTYYRIHQAIKRAAREMAAAASRADGHDHSVAQAPNAPERIRRTKEIDALAASSASNLPGVSANAGDEA